MNHEDEKKLKVLFNRDFTSGYLFGEENIMNFKTPNHQGIKLGKVTEIKKDKIKIFLEDDLYQEDGIRFASADKGFIVNFLYDEKMRLINKGVKGTFVFVDNKMGLKSKDTVLKTFDKNLMIEIQNYEPKKIKVTFDILITHEDFTLKVCDNRHEVLLKEKIVSQAIHKPLSKEDVIKQMNRLKDTPFEIEKITIKMPADIFIPVSSMNEIRRKAILKLIEKRRSYV